MKTMRKGTAILEKFLSYLEVCLCVKMNVRINNFNIPKLKIWLLGPLFAGRQDCKARAWMGKIFGQGSPK